MASVGGGGSTAVYIGDPYQNRRSPQRVSINSTTTKQPSIVEPAAAPTSNSFVPWRRHQKTHSSISLNTAYGQRHSLESLSTSGGGGSAGGGSLRNATMGGRSLRWKFHPQIPFIEKLSDVAHIHYDLVELGPIKVEVLPFGADVLDLDTSTSSNGINRRSYHHHHYQQANHQAPLVSGLSVLHEDCSSSPSIGLVNDPATTASSSSSANLRGGSSRVGLADLFLQQRQQQQLDVGVLDCATRTAKKFSPTTKIYYTLRVHSNQQTWTIQRTYEDFVDFDKQLHRCVYHRHFSLLNELPSRTNLVGASSSAAAASAPLAVSTPSSTSSSPQPPPTSATFGCENSSSTDEAIWTTLSRYMERFSDLAGSLITCFPVLKWLELDNRGNHLVAAEETQINTPAIAAAYVVQNYTASAVDELTLKVGDIVSVIDMPPASESVWWQGKLTILKAQYADVENAIDEKQHQQQQQKLDGPSSTMMSPGAHFTIQVGFFPSHCVQLFGNRVSGSLPGALRDNSMNSRPVFRRRGKWATRLRLFLANRPSRRLLKEAGILKERVFGCDLAEHLENTGVDVPIVLKTCASVIETCGIVDGIYRGSGIVSNIQRLRTAFDENRVPNLLLQDVHCVASLLKMYFRELPNPLLTFQLYDNFVEAVNGNDSSMKILRLHDVVQQLPPPYFRTAEYLIKHLSRVGEHGHKTGMHYPNLALVWAPNLLRSKELETVKETTEVVLRNVNIQAIIVEYLIRYADIIFSRNMPSFSTAVGGNVVVKRRARPMSLACPSSLSPPSSPPFSNLMNLDDAKRKLMECRYEKVPANVGLPDLTNRKCIDVSSGGTPPKYHTVIQLPGSKSRSMKLNSSGSAGGWRMLFHGRKSLHETSDDATGRSASRPVDGRPPRSPVISAPKLIRPPREPPTYHDDRSEDEGNSRKRLRHVRSAENFQAVTNGKSTFVSLDASIRESATRRSLRRPKSPQAVVENNRQVPTTVAWMCSTPSPIDEFKPTLHPNVLRAYPSNTNGQSSSNGNTRASLKPCRTTDIDRVINNVIAVDSSPMVFSLRYNDGLRETDGGQSTTNGNESPPYFEATMFPIDVPSSPVSEPPACFEDISDDGEWIKNLLDANFAAIDDSFHDDRMDASFGSSSSKARKAFSAPNSLRRTSGSEKAKRLADEFPAIDQEEPAVENLAQLEPDGEKTIATFPRSITSSPDAVYQSSEKIADLELFGQLAPPASMDTASLTKQLSESEEKLLLAELRKTPPENSPSHDDLRDLFPELNNIYSSLEQIPSAMVSMIESERDGEEKDEAVERASSITDLDVIEANPEWTSPSGGEEPEAAGPMTNGANGGQIVLDERNANGGRMESDDLFKHSESNGARRDRTTNELLREQFLTGDSPKALSPREIAVQGTNLQTIQVSTMQKPQAATIVERKVSPAMESQIRGLLASVDTRASSQPSSDDADNDSNNGNCKSDDANSGKYISFNEANAVFDRRETLQAVQSAGRYDSEDEDSMFQDSIYDNVDGSSSSNKAALRNEHRQLSKPTPRPRVSKLRSSFDGSMESSSQYLDARIHATPPINVVVQQQKVDTKPQRPVVLTVSTAEQQHKNWSSSEESELANSPLFRKQQQQLFLSAPSAQDVERNRSEPPCVDSIATRLSYVDSAARSETHLNRSTTIHSSSPSTDKRPSATVINVISPSPRSAFSPVAPKLGGSRESGRSIGSNNLIGEMRTELGESPNKSTNSLQQPPLQSILATSTTKRSPSLKTKNAHVYFV